MEVKIPTLAALERGLSMVSECGKDGAPTFVSRMARADEGVRCSMSYLVSRCQASS
jgi:hypothetical protein